MKIELTKSEYRSILDLLYIGSWVMTAYRRDEEKDLERYDRVIQKFYARAGEAEALNLIEQDPKTGTAFPSAEFEETSPARTYIDEFVDDSFWDELIFRLAERDAAHRVGSYEKLQTMTSEEQHALEDPLEEQYSEEVNENGIENLVFVQHFGPRAMKPVKTSD